MNSSRITPASRRRGSVLAMLLALFAVLPLAAGAQEKTTDGGGRVTTYNAGTGIMVVNRQQLYVNPGAQVHNYDGSRASPAAVLNTGVSLSYRLGTGKKPGSNMPIVVEIWLTPN